MQHGARGAETELMKRSQQPATTITTGAKSIEFMARKKCGTKATLISRAANEKTVTDSQI